MTNQIAQQFAPVFIVENQCDSNIPTRLNFDGNWDLRDNAENYQKLIQAKETVQPTIYYQVKESKTHYFLTYYLYYPIDKQFGCSGLFSHPNDASSLIMIVKKGKGKNKVQLEWIVTSDHSQMDATKGSDLHTLQNHPLIRITNSTHGMRVVSDGKLNSFPVKTFHRFNPKNYSLESTKSIWEKRHDSKVFQDVTPQKEGKQFVGRRAGWAPWARGLGYMNPIAKFKSLYPHASESEYSAK